MITAEGHSTRYLRSTFLDAKVGLEACVGLTVSILYTAYCPGSSVQTRQDEALEAQRRDV